jgi:hypothetical protein
VSAEAEDDTNRYRSDVPSEQQKIRVTAFGLLSGYNNSNIYYNRMSMLEVNLNLSPNITTIMSGHGNIRSYL